MKEYTQEIIDFIQENKLGDIFTQKNEFYNLYGYNLYPYIRVSTEMQEVGRQLLELYEWAKKRNIKIYINNIFCDKYTGKTLKRDAYENLRKHTKANDYICISEISRLGRNWDAIKKEWYQLRVENINIIVMDNDMLSASLPNEAKETMTVDKKFIQEMVFNGVLYASCKKIEEVRRTTKYGLEKARKKGKKIGRPTRNNSSTENFINVLESHIDGLSIDKATNKYLYPRGSFSYILNNYKKEFNTDNKQDILKILKERMNKNEK